MTVGLCSTWWDYWNATQRERRYEMPNRDLGDSGRTRCRRLVTLHLRDIPNSDNRQSSCVDSRLLDVPDSACSPLPAQFLFRPSCQRCHVCARRCGRRNHPPTLPNPFPFKLTITQLTDRESPPLFSVIPNPLAHFASGVRDLLFAPASRS